MKVLIPHDDEALLRQCEVQTYCSSGPGGQHVNRTESAVRLRHRPTGTVATAQDERSQHRNKATALERLREKLRALNRRQKPRIETRTPPKARRKRLEGKHQQAEKKSRRQKPSLE